MRRPFLLLMALLAAAALPLPRAAADTGSSPASGAPATPPAADKPADSTPASPEATAEAFRLLHSRYFDDRQAGRDMLAAMGREALPALVKGLKDSDFRVRSAAVELVGRLKMPEGMDPLIEALGDADPEVGHAAAEALAAYGEAADAAIAKIRATSPERIVAYDWVVSRRLAPQIEALLAKEISKNGGTGFYKGQWDAMKALGPGAAQILFEMIVNPEYEFATREDPNDRFRMRQLATEAIGDIMPKEMIPRVQALYDGASDEVPPEVDDLAGGRLHDGLAASLWRVGVKGPLESLAENQRIAAELDFGGGPGSARGSYATTLVRMEKFKEAERFYLTALKNPSSFEEGGIRYNLSCLYSMQGRKGEALQMLRSAMDAGYDDPDWMTKDRDIDGIRGEPGFAELMALADKNSGGEIIMVNTANGVRAFRRRKNGILVMPGKGEVQGPDETPDQLPPDAQPEAPPAGDPQPPASDPPALPPGGGSIVDPAPPAPDPQDK